MITKEYGAWPTWNVSSSGQKKSFDPYNRHLKKERFPRAEEYACRNLEQYHHYSEYNDLTAEEYRKKKKDDSNRSRNSSSSRMRIMQQVVCFVAGSTIIVSSYNAVIKQQQAEAMPQPAPPAVVQEVEDNPIPEIPEIPEEEVAPQVASVEWVWDDANKSANVKLLDSEGNIINESLANISIATVDATCNKEGSRTYTASVDYEGESYTDSKTETIQPLGHSFDDGKETVLSSGQSAMEFECKRCHEHFTIATSSSEKDD